MYTFLGHFQSLKITLYIKSCRIADDEAGLLNHLTYIRIINKITDNKINKSMHTFNNLKC